MATIVADRNSPQKHVWRAEIVLLTADRLGRTDIMHRAGKAKIAVWRWQGRFMRAGVDSLRREKARPSRVPPLPTTAAKRVLALTMAEPPGETTHWTADAMAEAVSVSASSVRRIWRAHGLLPHRIRRFKLSDVPQFATELRGVVALCDDPPAHAIVQPVDEKSQIQELDRTLPGLPLKQGRCGIMTRDYIRNGTTTLSAALDVLEGMVIGHCMQGRCHQEFIRFLNTIEADVAAGKAVHVSLDNYAAHKHPKVMQWLRRHSRFVFHFTPTSACWLNGLEELFAKLASRKLEHGVFHYLVVPRRPSTASLRKPTPTQGPSTGPRTRMPSSGSWPGSAPPP